MNLPAFVFLLLIIGGASALILLIDDEYRKDVLVIGAVALATRAVVAFVTFLALSSDQFTAFPDEVLYLSEASQEVASGSGGAHAYSKFLGWVFSLTGEEPWVARSINVMVGTGAAILAFELARRGLGLRAARATGVAVAVWPSMVTWSVFALQDPLIIFFVLVGLLAGVIAVRGSWTGAGVCVVALVLLGEFRGWALLVAALSLLVTGIAAMVVTRFREGWLAPMVVLIAGIVFLVQGSGFLGLSSIIESLSEEGISSIRSEGEGANTTFGGEGKGIVGGIPQGVIFGILGPYPWDAGPLAAKALLLVELPLWYLTLILAGFGVWKIRRGLREPEILLPISFALGVFAVLLISVGNAGTAIRLRSMAIPAVIILGAASQTFPFLRERAATANVPDSSQDREA